jgi:FecR protein
MSNETDDPRRRLLIKALAAGLFYSAIPTRNALAGIFGTMPTRLPAAQSIYRLTGTATVNGQEANLATHIGPNDTIHTGHDSELIFVVGTNAMILRGNSQLELHGNKDSSSLLLNELRMITGRLLSVSRNQAMRVTTPAATLGIRGTGFYVESDPELTYFCTCYGTTDVSANSDPASTETVVSRHHDKPLYIAANSPPGLSIRRAEFKNHTDHELMLIETLVGRSPPFVFPIDDYNAPRRDINY